jgi:hypothetical protein
VIPDERDSIVDRAYAHLIEYRRTETHLPIGARLDLINVINEFRDRGAKMPGLVQRELEQLDYEAGLEAPPEEVDEDALDDWAERYAQTSRASG